MQSSLLIRLGLCVDADAKVLICTRDGCKTAISVKGSRATTHLCDKHNSPLEERRGLTALLRKLELNSPDLDAHKILPREDGSPEHPHLRVENGFHCKECGYRSISLQLLKRHYTDAKPAGQVCPSRTEGESRRVDTESLIEYVYVQTWYHGPRSKYWLVSRNGSTIRPPILSAKERGQLEAIKRREQARVDSYTRTVEQCKSPLSGSSLAFGEQRPWIERTGWEAMFRGRDLNVLSKMIYLPGQQRTQLALELAQYGTPGLEQGLTSSAADETKIAHMLMMVNPMMERCDETARRTSRNLRCWLKSVRYGVSSPEPFNLVRLPSSTQKYRLLQRKLLAFVFRLYRLDRQTRQQLVGLGFTRRTIQLLDALWAHEYWADSSIPPQGNQGGQQNTAQPASNGGDDSEEDEEDANQNIYNKSRSDPDSDIGDRDSNSDDSDEYLTEEDEPEDDRLAIQQTEDNSDFQEWVGDNGSRRDPEPIVELLFGLSLALCKEKPVDDNPGSLIIVFFSGILGFSEALQSFLPARSYTSYLSVMIYNQRLLFLESTIPLLPYHTLGIEQRPRTGQLALLDKARRRYMITGSQSSFDELFSLRNYGRVIAKSDTPPFLLYWSDDGHQVRWNDSRWLTMGQFRLLSEYFSKRAATLCEELLLGLNPPVDLARVKDVISNTQAGYSFVSDPANGLHDAYLQLAEYACSARQKGLSRKGKWDRKAVKAYLKKEDDFRVAFGLAMQTQGGQVARWTELLNLWCTNTEYGPRGLFAYKSHIMYIIRHHKVKRSTNREFVVARFLGAELSVTAFKYLAYIRPFKDLLYRDMYGRGLPGSSPLLFRAQVVSDSKAWPTSRFNDALKKATGMIWSQAVNSQVYRQLCVGITEKHVREVYEPQLGLIASLASMG